MEQEIKQETSDKIIIQISKETWKRLNTLKNPSESFDDVIIRLLSLERKDYLNSIKQEDLGNGM